MYVIGLTGGIGSGKTAVANEFIKLGIDQVDTDIIAREVVNPGQPALLSISNHFGSEILLPNGQLNRALLREKVFKSPAERQWLEKLLHPIIRTVTISSIQAATSDYCLLVSPLLLETDQYKLCDHVLVVDVPESQQITRTTTRDNNTKEQVRAILKAQLPRTERLARADHTIDNSGPIEELREKVSELDLTFRQLAMSAKNR